MVDRLVAVADDEVGGEHRLAFWLTCLARATVFSAGGTAATDVVQGVLAAVHTFMGAAEPHDDLTLLATTRTIGWPADLPPPAPLPSP